MIGIGGKRVSQLWIGGKAVSALYVGSKLVWEAVSSCFDRFWRNDYPWKNEDVWKSR